MTATGTDAPAVTLLIAAIAFCCGAGVASVLRRPKTPIGRQWVQPRHDLNRSRR